MPVANVVLGKRRQNFQTISWFWDLHQRKFLDLDPPYQRRSVWNQSYKDDFIDTVLLQYSSPAIFLYEEISAETGLSKYHVVDGKQRLNAVFDFIGGAFPVSDKSPIEHLRGKSFSQLASEEKIALYNYEFTVEYLPTNEDALITNIFQRINKNTAKLTPQELRHARFNGLFIVACEQLAEAMIELLPAGFPRFEPQSRKQMKDVELVANLLLFLETGPKGYSQEELDQAFSDRETEWEQGAQIQSQFLGIVQALDVLARSPHEDPLFKTRLKNQADFYSLFGAIAQLERAGSYDRASEHLYAERLKEFVNVVDSEEQREQSYRAKEYLKAARSNSNDIGPRKVRIQAISDVLQGVPE
jgi:uncharacterized protein DUF262